MPPKGHLTMSGDILGCHNLGMDGGSAAGLRWIEARDAINIAWDVHILKKTCWLSEIQI